MNHDEIEDHDRGLSHDLPALLNRRRALGIFGGAGLAVTLAACGDSGTASVDGGARTPPGGQSTTPVGDGEIPEETNGPYPADGTNGPNVLTESGVVRSDIRSSFGGASGVADGVPLAVVFTIVDVSGAGEAGKPAAGAALYAWHCDAEGRYSLYSEGVEDENYLRGVQEADADGTLSFTTVFPGCYDGRWPHIHFEVYPSLDDATEAQNRQRTSQLAFPADVCEQVYATDGYPSSADNLSRLSLESDMVFSDGYSLQLAKMSGSVDDGYTATLRVPI